MGVGCCTRCWTRQNTPRPLHGPLQRTCGPRTARGAALESLAAPLAPEKCVSTPKLRARSAALSKLIVRTEQNNFAGGGTVAGLVLWAPVAARRAEVRPSGPNLVPPRSMWNKCFGRRKLTTICCTGCWGLAKTPRGRSAALSGELGGARNVPRNRAGKCRDAAGARTVCAAAGARWEEERLLQAPCVVESGASEDFEGFENCGTIKGVRAGSSREISDFLG